MFWRLFGDYYRAEVSFYDPDYKFHRVVPNSGLRSTLASYVGNEYIRWAAVYQGPLDIDFFGKEFWRDDDGREELAYHAFVLFETKNYWYSLEKNAYNVVLQRSKNLTNVYKYVTRKEKGRYYTFTREGYPNYIYKLKESSGTKGTTHSLIGHLYTNGLVSGIYNLFSCNCKDFAAGVYNYLSTNNKFVPASTYLKKIYEALPPLIG